MAPIQRPVLPPSLFEKLRELLRLIAAIGAIDEPLTTPEGLKKAIAVVLELAAFLGLDDELVRRIGLVLTDETVFQIVLAIVRYLAGMLVVEGQPHDGRLRLTAVEGSDSVEVDVAGFLDWLPIVLELIELIRRLRGLA
ncbi:MAG: hypothetical protein WD847_02665 [Pirellulales bacterium]